MTHDGHTSYIKYCTRCPDLTTWPAKNLIVGCCPYCGAVNDGAWRMAVARRLINNTEVETYGVR